MEFRNPAYNASGSIDCEINHPDYGWIPHTIPADENPDLQAAAIAAGVAPYVAPTIDPAVALAAERAAMVCSPMQGILTLGETEWAKVVAYRDTQAAWAEKVVIDSALDWRRTSQNIAFFQYLLGYTDAQVDDLFRAAMQVTV